MKKRKIVFIFLIIAILLILLALFFLNTTSTRFKNLSGKSIFDILSFGESPTCIVDGLCSSSENSEICPIDCEVNAPTNENVLCIFNNNSELSEEICEYYLLKRSGAKSLGLEFPDEAILLNKEVAGLPTFNQYMLEPVLDYVDSHPEINITHLAIAKDLPIKVFTEETYRSAQNYFSYPYVSNIQQGPYFGERVHFNPNTYLNESGGYTQRFAVSYLTGYNIEDIKMMIDKAVSSSGSIPLILWVGDMDEDQFSVNSGDLSGIKAGLVEMGINPNNILLNYRNEIPISLNGEIIAYGSPGTHHIGYTDKWMLNQTVLDNFSISNKSIIGSYESYNAHSFAGSAYDDFSQGNIADAFSSFAFGGENYSKSFSGAIGHVNEPGLGGVARFHSFFSAYASGLTFGESALSSFYSNWVHIAVGDPLMTLYSSQENLTKCTDCLYDSCSLCNCVEYPKIKVSLGITQACSDINDGCFLFMDKTESTFPSLVNINNNESICINYTRMLNCIDGEWKSFFDAPTPNLLCTEKRDVNSWVSEWKLKDGAECVEDVDCYYGGCDADLQEIKRCHSSTGGCILGDYGLSTNNNSYACYNDTSKIGCLNSNWEGDIISCQEGCYDGYCLEEFYYNNTFHFQDNLYTLIFLPLKTAYRNLSGLLSNEAHYASFLIWNGTALEGYNRIKFGDFVRWSGEDATAINPDNLAFFIALAGSNLSISGNEFQEPLTIEINKEISTFGIPFCYENYTASKLLDELNNIDSTCEEISTATTGRGPVYYWSYKNSSEIIGSEKDFKLLPYMGYWLYCSNESNFTFRPECEKQSDNFSLVYRSDGISLKLLNQYVLSVNGRWNISDLNESSFIINAENDSRGYTIIRSSSLNKGENKKVYVKRKMASSNAVCILDEEIENYTHLEENCISFLCPGSLENYSCIKEEDYFIISGLSNSGVLEDYITTPDQVSPGENTGGNGGGRNSGVNIKTNSSTINPENKTINNSIISLNNFTIFPSDTDLKISRIKYSIIISLIVIIVILVVLIIYFLKKFNRISEEK